jgi:hypothetical protein
MTALRQRMLDDLRTRNCAPSTVECYIRAVAAFAKHFNKSPDQLGPEEIRQYQLFLLNKKKVKLATYIQAVAALRFLYRNTLHRKIDVERIPLPRYEQKLLPLTAAEDLLEIVMRRYERASTLLTLNRPVEDWGKLLGDVAAVTAMLDRILHHGRVLKCGPRSWRTKSAATTSNEAAS